MPSIPGPTFTRWVPHCFIFWPASLRSPRRRGMSLAVSTATNPPPRLDVAQPGRQRGGRAGGRAGSLQASRGSLLRCRGDAPRHRGPAARPTERSGDPPAAARMRPAPGRPVRVPLGAGIITPAALAAGDQYRSARPSDRVCTGDVQDTLRAGPRRANLRRGPQSRHGRSRRRASVRMDRAAAHGRASRV